MALSSPVQADADANTPQIAILVDDVHVRYRVLEDRNLRLAELVRHGFRSRQSTEVHAVRGVSFTVNAGESVGLIGPNGSGKSTLLRAIAGVEPLSGGAVFVRGRAQLLAVNAALDPLLSGRRNIMLGGLAMGMPAREIEARVAEVIEFAELEDAIHRPMRTYSSGMKARLTFSIATMTEPPILLIDEALAVGDGAFRRKSLRRLRAMLTHASTVVMVTHNLNEVQSTCTRAIWLDEGRIVMDGAAADVVEAYSANADDSDDAVS
jgi:teichoic acid transport system ATP-binding protein